MNKRTLKIVLAVALSSLMVVMFTACGTSKNDHASFSELVDVIKSAELSDFIPETERASSDVEVSSESTDEEKDLAGQLVGKWLESESDVAYAFNKDGTGTKTLESEELEMTWTLSGSTLTIDFPDTKDEEYKINIENDNLSMKTLLKGYEFIRQ